MLLRVGRETMMDGNVAIAMQGAHSSTMSGSTWTGKIGNTFSASAQRCILSPTRLAAGPRT